jgi:hypothetical protein
VGGTATESQETVPAMNSSLNNYFAHVWNTFYQRCLWSAASSDQRADGSDAGVIGGTVAILMKAGGQVSVTNYSRM